MLGKLLLFIIIMIWSLLFVYFMVVKPFHTNKPYKYLVYILVFLPTVFFIIARRVDLPVFSFTGSMTFLVIIAVFNVICFVIFLVFTKMSQGIHTSKFEDLDELRKHSSVITKEYKTFDEVE